MVSYQHKDQPISQQLEKLSREVNGLMRAKELDHAFSYFLAKEMQPFYTVEKPGF